jgi:hypothetical protein
MQGAFPLSCEAHQPEQAIPVEATLAEDSVRAVVEAQAVAVLEAPAVVVLEGQVLYDDEAAFPNSTS